MAQPEQDTQSTSRWWEFYAVRYGMGSVVGGIIFFFLCKTNPALRPLLFEAGGEPGTINGPLLALLAGYGLAYCYIASAPILVFHVGRFLLDINQNKKTSIGRKLAVFAPPLLAALAFCLTRSSTGSVPYFFTMVFSLAAVIVWPQYLAILVTLFKSKELFGFYRKLASKRNKATGNIIDSYKHMREHGNSFLIVVLEIVLAVILFFAGNFDFVTTGINSSSKELYVLPYIAIVLIWILPAALVWLVGTLFERQFSGA